MKKILFLLSFFLVSSTFAASTGSPAGLAPSSSQTKTTAPLTIKDVTVLSAKKVVIEFSEKVQVDSVMLRINKQSDSSSILTDGVEGATDSGATTSTGILVSLRDTLAENSSYRMTVVSATTMSGLNIQEGIDAIREFSTETFDDTTDTTTDTLNAPTNESAVLNTNGNEPELTTEEAKKLENTTEEQPVEQTMSGAQAAKDATKVLPETGINPLILVLLALPIVVLFSMKRRVS